MVYQLMKQICIRKLAPKFHYDDIFGTVVNRFLVQAVAGVPLTVYGKGGQVRGYLNLRDTLQCIALAARNPPGKGELRILNQFTETFSINQLADRVRRVAAGMGNAVDIQHVDNPRKEQEEHYYNPAHHGLLELGLTATFHDRRSRRRDARSGSSASRSHKCRPYPAAGAVALDAMADHRRLRVHRAKFAHSRRAKFQCHISHC